MKGSEMKGSENQLVIREATPKRTAPDGTPELRIGWEDEEGISLGQGVYPSTAQFMEAADQYCDKNLFGQEDLRKMYIVWAGDKGPFYVVAYNAFSAISELDKQFKESPRKYTVTELEQESIAFAD